MSLQIARVDLVQIAMPLREPFRTSNGTVDVRKLLLTKLEDVDGRVVWGECSALSTPHYLPETIDTARTVISSYLMPLLLSRTFTSPSEVSALFDEFVRGHSMAKAALEMPMWALAAQCDDCSLAETIGGTRDAVEAGVAVGLQESPEALARKVEDCLSQGYRRVKMKIAPERDLRFIEAATNAAGGGERIQLDANCAYTLDDSDQLKAIDPYGVMMIEQPLGWNDLIDHAELQTHLDTPVCLDESLDGPDSVRKMIALEAGRIVCLKPGRVGGFEASLRIHDQCRAKQMPLWIGGMLESGIGRAYAVALASKSGVNLLGDLSPSARYWAQDIVSPEWTMDANGLVSVPRDRPGIVGCCRTR